MMDYPLKVKAEAAKRLIEIQLEIGKIREESFNDFSMHSRLGEYLKEIGPEYGRLTDITGTSDYWKLTKMVRLFE